MTAYVARDVATVEGASWRYVSGTGAYDPQFRDVTTTRRARWSNKNTPEAIATAQAWCDEQEYQNCRVEVTPEEE